MSKKFTGLSLALGGCLVTCTVHAAWAPRGTVQGEMGEFGSLWADGLFPVQDRKDQVIFFDLQVEANRVSSGDSFSGIVSPGIGVRHAFANESVLGGYLFSDYTITNSDENYWLLSPGMDLYQGRAYGSMNGYIPVNNAPRKSGPLIAASDAGITTYEVLTGNSQYDRLIQPYYTMRWGMDLTGGILFGNDNQWDAKLGTYLYDSQDLNTIMGGRGELAYYINDNLALMLEERYDNVFHNQTIIGIKFSFLGTDNRGTVASQLKAPIYRNLNINTTSAGTPIGEYAQISGQSYLIQDNIIFITNGTTHIKRTTAISGDGTYENPYTGLDQGVVNQAGENMDIWVEGSSTPYSDANSLTLQTGQSISGRTDAFKLPAYEQSTQPIFDFAPTSGSAALFIDNSNTLQNFTMRGNGADDSIGVSVINTGAGTATLNGVTVGTTGISTGYVTALYNDGANVAINNSTLYAIDDTVTVINSGQVVQGVFGVYNNGGITTLNNSRIVAKANNVDYTFAAVGSQISGGAWGVYNAPGGVLTIGQSNINATANNVTYHADTSVLGSDLAGSFGVYNNEGTVIVSDSSVYANVDHVVDTREPVAANSSVLGAFGLYNKNGTMTVSGASTLISATATNVDNMGFDPIHGQGLLDYIGAFGVYNNAYGPGNTATLNMSQAHVTSSATTVTTSAFSINDPSVSSIGVWNSGSGGTANMEINQHAVIDVDATWQIDSILYSGAETNSIGIYNAGSADASSNQGSGNLIVDSVSVTVSETGGDYGSGGVISGIQNGDLYISGISAVTVVKGDTHISAKASGNLKSVSGFSNNGNNGATDGTRIEEGVVIEAEGVSFGTASAVFNSIGNMEIQGSSSQNVSLSASGGESNYGIWTDNGASTTVDYATIDVSAGAAGYAYAINNNNANTVTVQHTNATVSSTGYLAYGVNNYNSTSVTISDSTFNVTGLENTVVYGVYNASSSMSVLNSIFNLNTSNSGLLYGLWDDGSGINILSPTALNFHYDSLLGNAYAYSSTGAYSGKSNVTCQYNGVTSVCTTSP